MRCMNARRLGLASLSVLVTLILTTMGCSPESTDYIVVPGSQDESGADRQLLPAGATFVSQLVRESAGIVELFPGHTGRAVIGRIDYSTSAPSTATLDFIDDEGGGPTNIYTSYKLPASVAVAGTYFLAYALQGEHETFGGGLSFPIARTVFTSDVRHVQLTDSGAGSGSYMTIFGYVY